MQLKTFCTQVLIPARPRPIISLTRSTAAATHDVPGASTRARRSRHLHTHSPKTQFEFSVKAPTPCRKNTNTTLVCRTTLNVGSAHTRCCRGINANIAWSRFSRSFRRSNAHRAHHATQYFISHSQSVTTSHLLSHPSCWHSKPDRPPLHSRLALESGHGW